MRRSSRFYLFVELDEEVSEIEVANAFARVSRFLERSRVLLFVVDIG